MGWYLYIAIVFTFVFVIAVFVINCCRFAGRADKDSDRDMSGFLGPQ